MVRDKIADIGKRIDELKAENRQLRSLIRSKEACIIASFSEIDKSTGDYSTKKCNPTYIKAGEVTQLELPKTRIHITLQDVTLEPVNDTDEVVRDDWLTCPHCLSPEVELKRSGNAECNSCGQEKEIIVNDR